MHSSWPSSATWFLFVSQAAAFYPYCPPYFKCDKPRPRDLSPPQLRAPLTKPDGITLLLHRTPVVKRTNQYSIVSALPPTQSDSVGIDQDGLDYTYFSPMSFGTSNEVYHMLMDTAASNTWVMSSQCTTDVCNEHNTLGTAQSSTLKLDDLEFSITYGTGNVNGTTATDTAHFAGKNVSLTFGLATGISSEFTNYALDGILGFGRGAPDADGTNAPSIIDVLASNKLIPARLVGVHLSRAVDPPNDGQMNLGAPDPGLYDGDLAYISVMSNDRGFWEVPIDDAGFNGQLLGVKGQSAILDTGTSFMLVPPTPALALHQQISGYQQSGETFTVPCSTTQPIQMVLGGKTYNISTADYIGTDAGNGACHSNIIGRQTFDPDQWLMGDVFLKNVYTVFDFDGARIGFGVKQGSIVSSSASQSRASSTSTSSASGSASVTASSAASMTGSPILPAGASVTGTGASASPTKGQSSSSPTSAGSPATPSSMSALAILVAIGSLVAFV